jgi:stress response protein SCP2
MKLSDEQLEAIKASLNNAIHELVFAVQHASQDDFDDAATCLVTAQSTIESVAEQLVEAELS